MLRNWLLVGLVVVLLVSLGATIGCVSNSGIAGTYVNQDDDSEYLELKADGTYDLREGGADFTGEWEVEGDEIEITWMGFVATGTIEDNKITDQDGKVWVKE